MKFERLQDHPPALAEQVANGLINATALQWFQRAMALHHAGMAPLDVALGLTAGNRKQMRDDALLMAANIIRAGRTIGYFTLAREVMAAYRVFERGELGRLRRGEEAVPTSDLNKAFWFVAQSGCAFTTVESIYTVLKNAS